MYCFTNITKKVIHSIRNILITSDVLSIKRAKDTYSKRLLLAGHIHAIHQTVRFSILNSSVPHLIYASVLVFEIIAKNENFLFNMGLNGENMKNGNLTLKN